MFGIGRKKEKVEVIPPKLAVPVSPAEVKTALEVFDVSESIIEVSTRAIKTQSQLREVVSGLERSATTALRNELKEQALGWFGGAQQDLYARLLVAAQITLGTTNLHPLFEQFRERLMKPYLPQHFFEGIFDVGKCTSHWNTISPGAKGMLRLSPGHTDYQKKTTQIEFDPASKQDEVEFWLAFAEKCLSDKFKRAPQNELNAQIWGGASDWILLEAHILDTFWRLKLRNVNDSQKLSS